MRVLDVGCGNGDLSWMIATLVGPAGEVVGIDRNEDALASARSTPPDSESARIPYLATDLSGDLPDLGRFDAIVGRRVLMYLPDAAATLERLATLAKPGTILAFQEHARAELPAPAGGLASHSSMGRFDLSSRGLVRRLRKCIYVRIWVESAKTAFHWVDPKAD